MRGPAWCCTLRCWARGGAVQVAARLRHLIKLFPSGLRESRPPRPCRHSSAPRPPPQGAPAAHPSSADSGRAWNPKGLSFRHALRSSPSRVRATLILPIASSGSSLCALLAPLSRPGHACGGGERVEVGSSVSACVTTRVVFVRPSIHQRQRLPCFSSSRPLLGAAHRSQQQQQQHAARCTASPAHHEMTIQTEKEAFWCARFLA